MVPNQADAHTVAIGQLYRRHAPGVYAHCRQLLGGSADASDAMQEAFVRVLSRTTIGNADYSVRYLYRTSTNACIDVLRQQGVRHRAAPEIAARARAATLVEPSHGDRQDVQVLFERCDDTSRSIAVMFYLHGMSQVEVAAALGISRRTVFTRLRQLERLAKELLGNDGVGRQCDGGESSGEVAS